MSRFDTIVAIGCLHHTGDIADAIASCRRLLVPGGLLVGMVYYSYSYRRWWNEPARTIRYFMREQRGHSGTNRDGKTFAYDHAQGGTLAPSTEFVSVRSLRSLCNGFIEFGARTENVTRSILLNSGRVISCSHRQFRGFAALICIGPASSQLRQRLLCWTTLVDEHCLE